MGHNSNASPPTLGFLVSQNPTILDIFAPCSTHPAAVSALGSALMAHPTEETLDRLAHACHTLGLAQIHAAGTGSGVRKELHIDETMYIQPFFPFSLVVTFPIVSFPCRFLPCGGALLLLVFLRYDPFADGSLRLSAQLNGRHPWGFSFWNQNCLSGLILLLDGIVLLV